MFSTLFILEIALWSLLFSLTLSSNTLRGMQTGSVQTYSTLPDPITVQFFRSFEITYTKQYSSSVPTVCFAIIAFEYCPPSASYSIMFLHSIVLNTFTNFKFFCLVHTHSTSVHLTFKFRYFVIDPNFNNKIKIQRQTYFPTIATPQKIVTFSTLGIDDVDVYKGCFFNSIIFHNGLANGDLSYSLETECSAFNSSSLIFTFRTSAALPSSSLSYQYALSFFAIVIFPNTRFHVQANILQTNNGWHNDNIVFTASDVYFIGLTAFKMPGTCLKLALKDNLVQLDPNLSTFLSAGFKYFLLLKIFFPRIGSYVLQFFSSKLIFDFNNSDDLQITGYSPIYLISSSSAIFSSSTTQLVGDLSVPNQRIQFNLYEPASDTRFIFSAKILQVDQIAINAWNCSALLVLSNIDDQMVFTPVTSMQGLPYFDQRLRKQKMHIQFSYQNNTQNRLLSLKTIQDSGNTIEVNFTIFILNSIKASVNSTRFQVQFIDTSGADSLSFCTFLFLSDNVENSIFSSAVQNLMQITFDYKQKLEYGEIKGKYASSLNPNASAQFMFKVITAVSIKFIPFQKNIKIGLIGIPNPSNTIINEFLISSGGPDLKQIEVINDTVVLITSTQNYSSETIFTISYKPLNYSYQVTISNLQCIILQTLKSNSTGIYITIKNTRNLSGQTSEIYQYYVNVNSLTKLKVKFINESVIVFKLQLQDGELSSDITIIEMYGNKFNNSLKLVNVFFECGQQFKDRQKLIEIICIVLDAFYLIIFFASVISCKKLLGVQLIFIIQFAYYSLIPLNIKCPPFSFLSFLKYSIGINPFFSQLQQAQIPQLFLNLGIKKNFLSNVNLMIIPLFILPLFYLPLKLIGQKSTGYYMKPRCLVYGKSFLFQVPVTILLFNSFNIYTSFVIQIQQFNFSNAAGLAASIISALLLPTMAGIYFKWRKQFQQFNSQFDYVDKWLKLKGEPKLFSLRKFYPMLLITQMIIIPIILSIQATINYSLYVVLGIQVICLSFVVIVPLSLQRSIKARYVCHRIIILIICAIQISARSLSFNKDYVKNQNHVYYWHPYALLFFIFLGLVCTGGFAIFQCVKFWKSPRLVDNQLRIKQKNLKKKPLDGKIPAPDSAFWYPRNQFTFKELNSKTNQLQKSNRNENLIQNSQVSPVEKMQMWFKQIETDNYFQVLGLDRNAYFWLKENGQYYEIEKYVKDIFKSEFDLFNYLMQNSAEIVTLKDCVQALDMYILRNIKKVNMKRYQS